MAAELLITDEELHAREIGVEAVAGEIIKICMRDIQKLNCLNLRGEHTMMVKHCAWLFM